MSKNPVSNSEAESFEEKQNPTDQAESIGLHENVKWIMSCAVDDCNYDGAIPKLTDEELEYCLTHDARSTSLEKLNAEKKRRNPAKPKRKKPKEPKQTPDDAAKELEQSGAAIEVDGVQIRLNPMIATWRLDNKPDSKLMKDIKKHGQLQNLIFRKLDDGALELIAGHRRMEALRTLKIPFTEWKKEVHCCVTDEEAILMASSENLKRKDLNQIEQARIYQSLTKLGFDSHQISEKLEVGESTVRERLNLLELPMEVQTAMLEETIPYSCARALVKLNGRPETQKQMATKFSGSAAESYQNFRPWSAEAAEKAVDEILQKIQLKKDYAEKYGPCPRCNGTDIQQHGYNRDSDHEVQCNKCGHIYNGKTRLPWLIDQIQEKAAGIGLKVELNLDENKIKLSPQEVTDAMTKIEKQMGTGTKPEVVEQISPVIHGANDVTELTNFLLRSNGVLSFTLNDAELTLRLAENTGLHYKAEPHQYGDGAKTKITVLEEQYSSQLADKLVTRKPKVEQYLQSIKEATELNPDAPGILRCVSCDKEISALQAVIYTAPGQVVSEPYCQDCAKQRGITVGKKLISPSAEKSAS